MAQSLQELHRPLVLFYECGIVEFYPTPYPTASSTGNGRDLYPLKQETCSVYLYLIWFLELSPQNLSYSPTAGISSPEFQVRKKPRVLQERLLIMGRCRVPVEEGLLLLLLLLL